MGNSYNTNSDMSFLGANAKFFTVSCIAVSIIPAMRMSNASVRAEKEA